MKLPLLTAIATATLAGLPLAGVAQTYPDKPISVIVPWAPGGAADINVRSFVDEMSKSLKQPMPVLNKVGASGTIGSVELARAQPDGYTIGNVSVGPLTTQPAIKKLAYGADSFDYVCMHYSNPQFFVVAKDAPYNNAAELQAWLKANPQKAKFGSPGIGSIPHVAGLALGKSMGTPLEHIPFKSDADMLVSTLNGDIVGWITQATFLKSSRDRIKPIGVMSQDRMDEFREVATFREQKHDLVFDVWGGLAAPKGTPAPVLARLESACQEAFQSATYKDLRARLGMAPVYMGGRQFADYIARESQKNAALLKEAGVTE
jgi:tripartite-type tricarboxylate transporter receptor subunit TctC